MKKEYNNRRNFLEKCAWSTVPFFVPNIGANTISPTQLNQSEKAMKQVRVNFISDGLMLSPTEYLELLNTINGEKPIEPDFYGNGGATQALEDEFAKLTGKEKAIYFPTGTMANQIAIKLLNGNNTKAIVPENSHIFRDEADAAQSVHNKRLVPVGKDKVYYDLTDLKETINYLDESEVFKSGLGTIVIENPIRRAEGRIVPIAIIKEISAYCQENGYKMHLDGARLHIAVAYTNVSLKEYASHFDTVYISLYKYLNAAAGGILCGDAELIEQVVHEIKILGGTVFQNWSSTAVALHYLNGIEERWKQVLDHTNQLIIGLNKIDGVEISKLQNGSNIYNLRLDEDIDLKEMAMHLYKNHNLLLGRANEEGIIKFKVNESLLTRSNDKIIESWKEAMDIARK